MVGGFLDAQADARRLRRYCSWPSGVDMKPCSRSMARPRRTDLSWRVRRLEVTGGDALVGHASGEGLIEVEFVPAELVGRSAPGQQDGGVEGGSLGLGDESVDGVAGKRFLPT